MLVIPEFLSPSECAELITLAEHQGFQAAGVRTNSGQQMMTHIRNNEKVMIESPHWVSLIWSRLNSVGVGLPRGLRFYKYNPTQRFKMHKDGPWHEDGLTSQETLLIYLNEDFKGGTTDFRGGEQVIPKTGTLLTFEHDTWHEGAAVVEGVKYVLRSDILYDQTRKTRRPDQGEGIPREP